MPSSIEHVSDTAFWVAYYRWVETERKDALFHDPLAKKLAGDRGRALATYMGTEKAMAWSMALRTYIIDQYITDLVEKGVDMVINLGAGLDSRPYRLALPPHLEWVEVDFKEIIDYKAEILSKDKPNCHLKRIACDLAVDADRQTILQALNGQGKNILVLTEGVVPYLSNEAVTTLAQDLVELDHVTYWISDYFSPLFLRISARGKIRKRLSKRAPFLFAPGPSSQDWPIFFAKIGWQIKEMRFIGDEGFKVGRKLPTSWLIGLLMRLASEARLRPYKQMTGYAVLVKGHEVIEI